MTGLPIEKKDYFTLPFASLFLMGMAGSYAEKTSLSERLGLSVAVAVFGLPVMLLGVFFLRRAFNRIVQSRKAWMRSAYILLPIEFILYLLAVSGLFSSPSGPARQILFFVVTLAFLPVFIVGINCLRRGIRMR